jgi:prepilin-type N-terminal cleavage/methylation domain-containing protein
VCPHSATAISREARNMRSRKGVSIIETLVVIAIVGILLALLLPAVQSARTRSLELECKNNLHQLNLAIADFSEAHKRLPGLGSNGLVGGWTIDVLPFLDQKNLQDRMTPGNTIQTVPDYLLRQPRIFRCPIRSAADEPIAGVMEPSSYLFVPYDRRKTFHVFDAPIDVRMPWASGPEMRNDDLVRETGPHHRGFFVTVHPADSSCGAG